MVMSYNIIMRLSAAAVLVWAATAASQEEQKPLREEAVFSFAVEQSWILRTGGERDVAPTTERELTRGLTPLIRPPGTPVNPNNPPVIPPPPPPAKEERPLRETWAQHGRSEPFKLEGDVTLRADGTAVFTFRKIEYRDKSQRWWIEFEEQKIRAIEVGSVAKWQGTRQQWLARLETLETAFIEQYLRAVTPQEPKDTGGRLGLPIVAAEENGQRLFVTGALEEQLSALLLCRLDGFTLEKARWPADAGKYPPRVLEMARSLVERILAQCSGELAPAKARAARGRSVKEQPWDPKSAVAPAFQWADGRGWAAERRKIFDDARSRLSDLATRSYTVAGIDDQTWRNAVKRELDAIQDGLTVRPAAKVRLQDACTPRTVEAGKAVYDFKEDLEERDGKLFSSRAESHGALVDAEVAFFASGANRWRLARARLDTWYKGQVKRK